MKQTTKQYFSAIFWNVWAESQLKDQDFAILCARFKDFIGEHKPDIFGLNEVLVSRQTGRSRLLDFLHTAGYQTFFVPFGPENATHTWGSAIAYRDSASLTEYSLGPDRYAEKRGFPGHSIKLIHAQLDLPVFGLVNVVVNYLAHLVPYNIKTHLKHYQAFRQFLSKPELDAATIIGGDFNQFKFMARLWRAKELYHRATGTFWRPTWKWKGKIPLIQANYDNILWTKCGRIKLVDFRVLPRIPSDHTPLFAKFRIRPNNLARQV